MFVNWFIKSSHKFPQRPSVEVNNVQMTYQELGLLSSKIAKAIQKQKIRNSPIGLLTYRSFSSYAGILGIMYSKNIYLPLNPYFPINRTKKMAAVVKDYRGTGISTIYRKTQSSFDNLLIIVYVRYTLVNYLRGLAS